ncbi:MAG TPA: DEAD/DEAH box helicase, partial [Firmicutes bacterium]|nr:DEAD/DEAH box helicase [Bacillota bacterium]
MKFTDLHIVEPILRSLEEEGYTEPTEIQIQAIPLLLEGKDLLGSAQTGTGKTAAFAVPTLQRLVASKQINGAQFIRALILAPTRELAAQISDSFKTYGKHL